ncbi:hypothetical protein Henu3_gp82 [Mycobacterium phage Henu3]|uniref:Uncharacterized protein n=1 Tax=Mycobacterium phage Henu3 TaxID=2492961 RepID=A0A410T7Q7_9CAUD|nr:hypothetical protein I5G68_gp69 [Mycobacterium phage Henu3]QAU05014.1 hypothetical protein Henu3_gp82 [Mycobacterium phage Henu3]
MFSAITLRNVTASTLPSLIILPSSSALTRYSSCSHWKIGRPRSDSMFRSSVNALPDVWTLLKIAPMSARFVPAIAAVSPANFRYSVSSTPGLMPAATADAAEVAASSRPNAVPSTASFAFDRIASTFCVSLPRPISFERASSIAVNRRIPDASAPPTTAVSPAPATVAAVLRPRPIAEPTREPMPRASRDRFDSSCAETPRPMSAACSPALTSLPAVCPADRAPSVRIIRPTSAPLDSMPRASSRPAFLPTACAPLVSISGATLRPRSACSAALRMPGASLLVSGRIVR